MAGRARGLSELRLAQDGAQHYPLAAEHLIFGLESLFQYKSIKAGIRLRSLGAIEDEFSSTGSIGSLVAQILGPKVRPVRAIAFDKSDNNNWALGWHQDRTICVAEKADVDGFGRWTIKGGLHHVEPQFRFLQSMITMRVHVDAVDRQNAPLRIASGSHHKGLVSETELDHIVSQCETFECLAGIGDVWLYSTPILHASNRASAGKRRRVLQIDYCSVDLPEPLRWAFDQVLTERKT